MKSFKILILLLSVMVGTAHADQGLELFGEGLPLPWPFPWAKECPVSWESMEGRYMLSESSQHQEIDLDVSVEANDAYKIVRVARYTRWGEMISSGFSFVNEDQRSIALELIPKAPGEGITLAKLQLHYMGKDRRCTADNLVPILTLQPKGAPMDKQTQYRLLKLERKTH